MLPEFNTMDPYKGAEEWESGVGVRLEKLRFGVIHKKVSPIGDTPATFRYHGSGEKGMYRG
jgi:hypothetical protein